MNDSEPAHILDVLRDLMDDWSIVPPIVLAGAVAFGVLLLFSPSLYLALPWFFLPGLWTGLSLRNWFRERTKRCDKDFDRWLNSYRLDQSAKALQNAIDRFVELGSDMPFTLAAMETRAAFKKPLPSEDEPEWHLPDDYSTYLQPHKTPHIK